MKMNAQRFLVGALLLAGLLGGTPLRAQEPVAFPQEVTAPEGRIVIYQPQPEKLTGNALTGRAAVALHFEDKTDPVFGAFWFSARLYPDDDPDFTVVREIRVTKVRWPESTAQGEARFSQVVESAMPGTGLRISRDRLSASLATAEREQQSLLDLKNEAPKIVFVDEPAVLLLYDGEPQFRDLDDGPYERVVNTPFAVVRKKGSKTCWLTNGSSWYTAEGPLGPWRPTTSPPADLVQAMPKDDPEAPPAPPHPPSIVVATEPTELVVSDGEPNWRPLGDGRLLFVENTNTPWVRDLESQQVYVLLSGRWFQAATTSGPWTFVRPDKLPASFKDIPPASDLGGVRVSVPGTDEANDAVLDASIPQMAAIERSKATLDVHYDGAPKFEKIQGTSVSYAVNTEAQVLEIGGRYYACDNGVWFTSASATGPWAVADEVPEDEIQKIPPSAPVYNTTHVHVYESTPSVVYVGYTPGYMWSFPYYGVPFYGTGWRYPPYWGGFYYPRPVTFGFHFGYNSWTGWNFGFGVSSGFFHFGMSWSSGGYYRPGCCGGWYGGYRPGWGGGHWGNTTINIGSINIGNNVNFGNQARISNEIRNNPRFQSTNVQRDRTSVYNRAGVEGRVAPQAATPRTSQMARSAPGADNVMADRSGNVARRTPQGWETRSGDQWQNVNRDAARQRSQQIDRGALESQWQARQHGAARQRARTGGGGRAGATRRR